MTLQVSFTLRIKRRFFEMILLGKCDQEMIRQFGQVLRIVGRVGEWKSVVDRAGEKDLP